jgi:hypothetical protein
MRYGWIAAKVSGDAEIYLRGTEEYAGTWLPAAKSHYHLSLVLFLG